MYTTCITMSVVSSLYPKFISSSTNFYYKYIHEESVSRYVLLKARNKEISEHDCIHVIKTTYICNDYMHVNCKYKLCKDMHKSTVALW